MILSSRKVVVTIFIIGVCGTHAFSSRPTSASTTLEKKDRIFSLKMTPETDDKSIKKHQNDYNLNRKVSLSAFLITTDVLDGEMTSSLPIPRARSFDMEALITVLSASFLVTGNTVGAAMIVLPETASELGMLPSLCLYLGIYTISLVSGLLIGDVAIKQFEEKEDSSKAAPSSFKDLAGDLLQFKGVNGGQIVSIASIMINYCILSFAFTRSGELAMDVASKLHLTDVYNLSRTSLTTGFSVIIAVLVSTQSSKTLSQIASVVVSILFLSFGSLLMPGLANMQQDIFDTLITPGTYTQDPTGSLMGSISMAAPIFVNTMTYQSIVPTVTKLLGYDRAKVFSALTFGSIIPMFMYLAWCFVVLGGGVSTDLLDKSGMESLLLLIFSGTSIGGSSIACVMSIAGECNSQIANFSSKDQDHSKLLCKSSTTKDEESFSYSSVALAVTPPLAACALLSQGEEIITTLKVAGSYGSPLVYGILPALLAWKQRDVHTEAFDKQKDMVPGGIMSEVVLALCAIGFITEAFVDDIALCF